MLDMLVRALRIRLLLPRGQRPSLWRVVVVNAYGDAASAVTPARLGGDPARFVGFRRSAISGSAAVTALGVERVIDWLLLGGATLALVSLFGREGLHGVREIVGRLASRAALPWVLAVIAAIVAGGAAAYWYRKRHRDALDRPLREIWNHARAMSPVTLVSAGTLTAASMTLRVAILPLLLLSSHPGADLGSVIVGSFALLYGQLVLPTPSGVGGVELGFVIGLTQSLSAREIATLLIAWRVYTSVLPALAGGVAFVRSGVLAGSRWVSGVSKGSS